MVSYIHFTFFYLAKWYPETKD